MNILDRTKACLFILNLTSLRSSNKVKEAINKLSLLYPEELTEDRILLTKNGKSKEKSYLVYVFKTHSPESMFIIPELYVKNHAKQKNGVYLFKTENFTLETELSNGNVVRSDLMTNSPKADDSYADVFNLVNKVNNKDVGKIYSKKDLKKKVTIASFITVCLLVLSFIMVQLYNSRTEEERRRRVRAELELRENEEKRKALEKEITDLKRYYELLIEDENIKIKDALLAITGSLNGRGSIRSLSIDNSVFSLEVNTNNAVSVFSDFEKDSRLSEIKLSRLTNENGEEITLFTGSFSKKDFNKEPEELSLNEKKEYYQNLIYEYENKNNTLSVSEYVNYLKNTLITSSCTLVSIAQRDGEDGIGIEVSFNCNSVSLVTFLEQVQGKQMDLNIVSFRLRNNAGSLSCSAIFTVNEYAGEILKTEKESEDSDINSVLNYKTKSPTVVRETQVVKTSTYTFVGKGKNGDVGFILIKGADGKIEKIKLTDTTEEDRTAKQISNGYEVNLNGQIFEVRV